MPVANIKNLRNPELDMFNEHLVMMIDAGLPLPGGITRFSKDIRDPEFRRALDRLVKGLEQGETLSSAMLSEKRFFPRDYTALIRIGEQGGNLIDALSLAMEHERFEKNFYDKIKNSLFYPILVFIMSCLNYFLIVRISYPVFIDIFRTQGQNPPWIANFCNIIFSGAEKYSLFLLILMVLVFFLCRTQSMRLLFHSLLLKLPFIKDVVVSAFLANFSKSLSILLYGKISLSESLKLLAGITKNRIIGQKMEKAASKADNGLELYEILSDIPQFSDFYMAAVKAGENSQTLPDSLDGLADIYKAETQYLARLFIQILDIALILAAGLWVGILVVGMYSMYLKFFTVFGGMAAW